MMKTILITGGTGAIVKLNINTIAMIGTPLPMTLLISLIILSDINSINIHAFLC